MLSSLLECWRTAVGITHNILCKMYAIRVRIFRIGGSSRAGLMLNALFVSLLLYSSLLNALRFIYCRCWRIGQAILATVRYLRRRHHSWQLSTFNFINGCYYWIIKFILGITLIIMLPVNSRNWVRVYGDFEQVSSRSRQRNKFKYEMEFSHHEELS